MIKTLMAAALTAAFALPLVASAQSDTGASSKQPGANPPGAASPGSPSTTVTGTDRESGAAARTNPHGVNDSSRGSSSAGASAAGFDRLDKNRDGFVSRDEARDANELNTRFAELDRNNDGKLSRDEYNAINQGSAGATRAPSTTSAPRSTAPSMGSDVQGSAPAGKGPGAQESATRPQGAGGTN